MLRIRLLLLAIVLPLLVGSSGADAGPQISTIAFGSCANQGLPQPIWEAVNAVAPDLFVFLGDNIYADTTDPAVMQAKYDLLAAQPGFQQLRAQSMVAATWDDHDYGMNDAGADFPMKRASRWLFLNFWQEPWWSTRTWQTGGVFTAYTFGPPGRSVQLILLDTRWNRSPLERVSDEEYQRVRVDGTGPYTGTTDISTTLLGEAQWRWLEQQLQKPADLRLIATSIPFVQHNRGWEIWDNFPHERDRLVGLIEEYAVSGVLFITGDTHHAQFSRREEGMPYPLWEVNSSGLTENASAIAPDDYRVGEVYNEDNFGLITVDWSQGDPSLRLEIRSTANEVVLSQSLHLSDLRP